MSKHLGTAVLALLVVAGGARAGSNDEWPSYGNDSGAMRYSPLSQITPVNVTSLKIAWTYHMKPADAARVATSETTPLAVNGILYLGSPYGRIVALDGVSGKEIWSLQLPDDNRPAPRGIAYWPGDGKLAPELLFGTNTGKLMAVNVKTGKL